MMNGLQNIIGGLLAFGFSYVPSTSPISSWQALFMSYGILTVIWAIFVFWWMPDSPMRAKCFSEEDKRLMVERVRQTRPVSRTETSEWNKFATHSPIRNVRPFSKIHLPR
jgi:sugar phosphate permease